MKTLLLILLLIITHSDNSSFFFDFDLFFWIFIFSLNPSISTLKDFSPAIKDVKSTGKPKVSYSLNASSPFISLSLGSESINSLIRLSP